MRCNGRDELSYRTCGLYFILHCRYWIWYVLIWLVFWSCTPLMMGMITILLACRPFIFLLFFVYFDVGMWIILASMDVDVVLFRYTLIIIWLIYSAALDNEKRYIMNNLLLYVNVNDLYKLHLLFHCVMYLVNKFKGLKINERNLYGKVRKRNGHILKTGSPLYEILVQNVSSSVMDSDLGSNHNLGSGLWHKTYVKTFASTC